MPSTCFSYEPAVSPGPGAQDAAQSAPLSLRRMTTTHCFSCPADVPPSPSDQRTMPIGGCFGYPGEVPRTMPLTCCFSYSVNASPGGRNRDIAQPSLPGLRSMPIGTCFRY